MTASDLRHTPAKGSVQNQAQVRALGDIQAEGAEDGTGAKVTDRVRVRGCRKLRFLLVPAAAGGAPALAAHGLKLQRVPTISFQRLKIMCARLGASQCKTGVLGAGQHSERGRAWPQRP